jgi:hypothetical protein
MTLKEIKMKDIRSYGSKIIDSLEMQKYLGIFDYKEFVSLVERLEKEGIIKPVKKSKLNGKNPSIHNRYSIIDEAKDNSKFIDEIKYKLNYELSGDYFINHVDKYIESRDYVLALSDFLSSRMEMLKEQISIKERSFQIWGREKYLEKEGGKTLLKNLSFDLDKLNIYTTSEPLAYFSYSKGTPQKILIIENKDTFYTMRKFLLSEKETIMGEKIETVVYGSGKGIWNSFNDFKVCAEPYLLNEENELLYLGDIDYEGIFIYEQLYNTFKDNFIIKPFAKAYEYMINKAIENKLNLPKSKENQNKNIEDIFLKFFSVEYQDKIISILKSGRYIPQEIINYSDLASYKNLTREQ